MEVSHKHDKKAQIYHLSNCYHFILSMLLIYGKNGVKSDVLECVVKTKNMLRGIFNQKKKKEIK